MQVRKLRLCGEVTDPFSSDVEAAIQWLVERPSTIIMEPGELADFAQGHKLLTNGNAKIVILQDNESVYIPEGEYAYVTISDAVVTNNYKAKDGVYKVCGRLIRRPSNITAY